MKQSVVVAILIGGVIGHHPLTAGAQSRDELRSPLIEFQAKPKAPPGKSSPKVVAKPTAEDYRVAPDKKSTTAAAVERMLREIGYLPKLRTTKSGEPYIVFRMEGIPVNLFFAGCTKPPKITCRALQAAVLYGQAQPFHLRKINNFNLRYAYVRLARDERDPKKLWAVADLSFSGGMTPEIFEAWIGLFRRQNVTVRRVMGIRL